MTEQQMTPHQALSFLCSAIRCGEVFDGHHSQAAEIIRAALSHAKRREFKTEQDLISFLDGLYETAGPDSSALTGQKWAPAQRAIEGIRSHAEGEAPEIEPGTPVMTPDGPAVVQKLHRDGNGYRDWWVRFVMGIERWYAEHNLQALVPASQAPAPQVAPCGWRDAVEAVRSRLSDGGDGWAQKQKIEVGHLIIDDLIGELEALPQAAPQVAVPEGYTLVPVEPTHEMIEAGKEEADWYEHNAIDCYQAMLAAAPTAPAGEPITEHNQRRADPFTERQIKDAVAEGRRVDCREQPASDPDGLPSDWRRVVEGAADMLGESAKQHRGRGDSATAAMCDRFGAMLRDEIMAVPAGEPETPRPMSTAPRDGSMIRLLVQFTEHGTSDGFGSGPAWTIGANTYDDSGDDEWFIAGWNWQQDCFTAGEGEPLGWLPMLSAPAPDEREIAADAIETAIEVAVEAGRGKERATVGRLIGHMREYAKRLRAGKEGEGHE